MAVTVIKSNTPIDTEQHFLVKAGPGAGKTYWLIQHIKHVLSTSNRLGKIKKIACITYTNIGVEPYIIAYLIVQEGLMFAPYIVFCTIILSDLIFISLQKKRALL